MRLSLKLFYCLNKFNLFFLVYFIFQLSVLSVNCLKFKQHAVLTTKLGSKCKSSYQCSSHILNSHCNREDEKCECLPYHVKLNNTVCLPGALLTFNCQIDDQCKIKVSNSKCFKGKCVCKDNHIKIRKDKCLPPTSLNGYCLNDEMCKTTDSYSHCKWIIPHVYGKCKCLTDHFYSSTENKCWPKLGQNCFKNFDCEKSTKFSKCGNSNELRNDNIKNNKNSINKPNTMVVFVNSNLRNYLSNNKTNSGNSRILIKTLNSSLKTNKKQSIKSKTNLKNNQTSRAFLSPIQNYRRVNSLKNFSRQNYSRSSKQFNNDALNICRCISNYEKDSKNEKCLPITRKG